MVTGLFIIAITIPALLWLTWRRNADGARDDSYPSFRDWAVGEFDTLTGPVKGANATAEVLLPIAAVAVGMTVLGPLLREPCCETSIVHVSYKNRARRPRW